MFLENAFIRVALCPDTGGLLSLYDRSLARECLDRPFNPLLFRLMIPEGKRLGNHLDSCAPVVVSCTGDRAVLRYHLGSIDVTVDLVLDGPGVNTTLTVANAGRLPIEEVQFPWVVGLRRLPDDAIVTPSFSHRIIRDPLGEGLDGDRRHAEGYLKKFVFRYPERMATAWCDYGNRECGLTIEGRHTDFSMTDFFVHKVIQKSDAGVQRSLNLGTVFPHRIGHGETWQSPPVRISVHEGDWHVPARVHREWVKTWITVPERPAKFAESIGWHYFFMKHQDGHASFTYADLPRMAAAALAVECPYLMLFGWHEPGHDNDYMYGYIANEEWGGADALREGLRSVRALGVEPIPFFNGTLANIQCDAHKAFGHAWEATTREGAPYHAGDWAGFNFDAPTSNRGRMHHEICPCEQHHNFFIDTARRLTEDYGFGNLQLDQIAIKMMPCYNPEHGHEHPDHAYRDGLKALLAAVRERLRKHYPDSVMIGEGMNEFAGQWCDGAWTWDFLNDPEPVLYSLPWLLTSTAIDALEYGPVNRAFAHKISLDMRIAGGEECIDQYPRFAEHICRLSRLRRRVAPYYAHAEFRDQDRLCVVQGKGAAVKVFCDEPNGRVGVVIAEVDGQPSAITVSSEWFVAPRSVRLHSSLETRPVCSVSPRDEYTLTLEPYEVVVICVDTDPGSDTLRPGR